MKPDFATLDISAHTRNGSRTSSNGCEQTQKSILIWKRPRLLTTDIQPVPSIRRQTPVPRLRSSTHRPVKCPDVNGVRGQAERIHPGTNIGLGYRTRLADCLQAPIVAGPVRRRRGPRRLLPPAAVRATAPARVPSRSMGVDAEVPGTLRFRADWRRARLTAYE